MEKHSPSQKGILCRFYPKLCPWSYVFPDKPLSNRLSRRIFLEQKKLKRLPLLANLQVPIAEIQQESVTLKKCSCIKRRGTRKLQ